VLTGDAPSSPREHPGPVSVELSAELVQVLIDHARAGYPNEACGVIVGDRPAADGGIALRWEPCRNEAASPYRYRIAADDLLRLTIATDDADEAFWAIVHSHISSPAQPSTTDIGVANYPDALYVLVSLSGDGTAGSGLPAVRAWRIVDGDTFEVELRVTA
jgi:proteasome lid subunit RPN8/RPN11